MKRLLLSCTILLSLSINAQNTHKPTTISYQNAEAILSAFKDNSKEAVNGPFLLTIKSITSYKHNTHLNTQANPLDANNIIIELPPFIIAHYQKNYKSAIDTLFLNQNLVIIGKAKLNEYVADDEKQTINHIPTIKIIAPVQLGYYD